MHDVRRGGAVFGVVVFGLCAALMASTASAETLADAIALAYQTNPTLQAQRATQRALDESWVQARAGYRPTATVSAQARYNEIRTPRTTVATGLDLNGDGIPDATSRGGISESNAGQASLSLSQPLFTGGRVGAAVSAAQGDILAGREALRRVEAQVMAQVITAYVDVRRDQEALHIRNENVQVLERQLDESQARFDVGEITRTDVAQSEARLAASRASYQQAQAQLAISRATYAAVVGQNPGELAPEPALTTLLPGDVDTAFTVAEQNNPQLRQAEYQEEASRARVAGARAERMPNVALQASLGYSGGAVDPYVQRAYSRAVAGAAVVSVPIFSGGVVSSRIRQTVERNNADRITVEGVRRTVLQSVTQAWNQLGASRANISSTDVQVKAALIAAEGTRQEQQVGLRTTIDVLNAEQELRAAQLAQIGARRDEYVSAASVLSAMGRLEAQYLTPALATYDSKANFRRLRVTWGWVPWEEPISIIDSLLTPQPHEQAREAPPPKDSAPIGMPSTIPAKPPR